MRKTFFLLSTIIFSLFVLGTLNASSLIEYHGKYQNKHIELKATNSLASWFMHTRTGPREGSSETIVLEIKTMPGYRLLNSTMIGHAGLYYPFNAQNGNERYYTRGKLQMKGSFFPSFKFTLTYYICKNSSDNCTLIKKKFKIVKIRNAYGSHDIVPVKIVELPN